MQKPLKNYAFIDSQNLHLGVEEQGWPLDYQLFRKYLRKKYRVEKAYLFFGYIKEEEQMYRQMRQRGYELIFKPVIQSKKHEVKGNIDAELVLQAMIDYNQYDKAVIITGDGDFYCLVKYLREQGKLLKVLVPNKKKHSRLLRRAAQLLDNVAFINPLRHLLEFKK